MKKIVLAVFISLMLAINAQAQTITTDVCPDGQSSCIVPVQLGQVIEYVAEPEAGSYFAGWLSDACYGTGACKFTVREVKNYKIKAVFAQSLTEELNIYVYGKAGKVVSSPAGISCATGQECAYRFPRNSYVTLTATPDATSTGFTWKGFNCTGTGTCRVYMSKTKAGNVLFK